MDKPNKIEYLKGHILIKKLYKETAITLDDFLNETICLNPSEDHIFSVFGYGGELNLQQVRPPYAGYWFIDTSNKHKLGDRLASFKENKGLVRDCAILVWLVMTPPDDRWKYTREVAYDYIKSLPDVVRVELNREAGRKPKKMQDDWRPIFKDYVETNNLYGKGKVFKTILRKMEEDRVVEQEENGKYHFVDSDAGAIEAKTLQNYLSEINKASKSQKTS